MIKNMEEKVQILNLNPQNFEFQEYVDADSNLIAISESDTVFQPETDYIELYIYDESQRKIYPSQGIISLSSYKVLQGDVVITPEQDLKNLSFDDSTYNILYNFYRKRLYSSPNENYYIKEISSDRTEIRLDSNTISNEYIVSSTNEFIKHRSNSEYFVDFYLNFGSNKTIIANNVKLEGEGTDDPTVLIKLYEPLPQEFNVKTTLWVVEEISDPLLFQVKFPPTIEVDNDFTFIQGPNFSLDIDSQIGNSGQLNSLSDLVDSSLTSSARQIKNILNKKEIDININHENFSEFVNFSSAKTRLENFYYKVGLIESNNNYISASLGKITGNTANTSEFSASKAIYDKRNEDIINNFDDYEYFLYYNSGSSFSYPKSNTTPPYILYPTGSETVLNWIGSTDPNSAYYGGLALSASNYDEGNNNWLYNAIPEYLRDDPANEKYKLFIDMVGQHYDNVWVYTKDITKKFNADNRLDYGISRDLVDVAIKDFGVKLYSNNFDNKDLYTAFLGLTPSGSLFPFPEISNELPTPSGYEYVNNQISSSSEPIAIDGVNKRLYKRIYHNIPYLLKTKGTIAGLRALITSYGIPDTILRINEFGGKDRNNSQDWDLKQKVFNYEFDTEGKYIISSSFTPNSDFGGTSPKTVQFRFKTRGIPNILSQSLYYLPTNNSALVLEYTGSGLTSGSYSGSIADPYNKYGTMKFIPDINSSNISASLYFPFFDGEWWSVQTTVNSSDSASLFAANKINGNLGFSGSSTISGFDSSYYFGSNKITFPSLAVTDVVVGGNRYKPLSGSYQEIRYYNSEISSNVFYDYTMNPYSFEGNTINSAPEELIFRADLGTLLNTGSTTSVHPKITGSYGFATSSFASNSNFYISSSNFVTNKEDIYQDQVVGGIKNRITDHITTNDAILPEGGTLSPIRSIQQTSFESSSYTPNADYLEVAFSPQDQINDDINAQMGYFNIGEYIGDPRHISASNRDYPDLNTLRDAYFNKYIDGYNLVDFVRLMKFFDNSLFKMIKDFTPARTSLTSGVVVKQHILERNRQRPAQVSYQDITYTGSVKPQARNYNTGSGDVGPYELISGSSIYKFSGGTGGSLEEFNGLKFSPSASAYGLSNRFGITQSYSASKEGTLGKEIQIIFNQDEFYNGEFSGSNINVVTQSLSPGCMKYHDNPDIPLQYYPLFFSDSGTDFLFGTTTLEFWNDRRNEPQRGYAWIFTEFNPSTQSSIVKKIKIAGRDINGNEIRDSLLGTEFIQFIFPEGFKKYYVDGTVINSNSATLTIEDDRGDYAFVSSSNGGTENWSLRVYGNVSSSNDPTVSGFDPNSQNFFHAESNLQIQPIRFYNGEKGDILGFFNTGAENYVTQPLLNNDIGFSYGGYTIPRTPNIPWVLSASIAYSASGGGEISTPIITQGVYHSGSFQSVNSRTQNVQVNPSLFETASIYHTSQTSPVNLDSSFFRLNTQTSFDGNQLFANRRNYVYQTDTSITYIGTGVLRFNNSTITNATQIGISIRPEDGGYGNQTTIVNELNASTSLTIFKRSDTSQQINIRQATTNTINSFRIIKQFSSANISVTGSFSDNDEIKILPSVVPDSTGHPLVTLPGTASFNFDFDRYAIGGVAPPPPTETPQTLPLQGPDGDNGSSTNPNLFIQNQFLPSNVGNQFVLFPSGSTDGQLSLDFSKLVNYLGSQNWNDTDVHIKINYQLKIQSGIPQPDFNPASPTLFNLTDSVMSQIEIQQKLSPTDANPFVPQPGTTQLYPYPAPTTQTKQFIQLTISRQDLGLLASQGREFNIRLSLTAFNTTLTYKLNYIDFELQFSTLAEPDSTQGFAGVGDPSNINQTLTNNPIGSQTQTLGLGQVRQNASFATIAFAGRRPKRFMKGSVRTLLWVTGSEHHPRQLITGSNELISTITGSSVLTFPDSPINNIYRTSSYNIERFAVTESSGASVTFQYTDPHKDILTTSTFTSGQEGVISIRQGETQPTKTGGSGTIVSQSKGIETLYPTINNTGSMYFIEHRIESASLPFDLTGNPFPNRTQTIEIANIPDYPKLQITNSVGSSEEGYRFTGSLQIFKGNADNKSTLGIPIFSRDFIVPNSESTAGVAYGSNDIQVSGSFLNNFKYNDVFRLVVRADKSISSKLDITEYTMSIFPSESKFAEITEDFSFYGKVPGSASYGENKYGGEITRLSPGYGKFSRPHLTDIIVPSFYGSDILPFALALDCQPLINNYNAQRPSTYLMDVDYTNVTGSITPVNFLQILSGSAIKATVPDSNYEQASWVSLRYDGSKAESSFPNVWLPTDFGTYGQLPVLELKNAYFAYFSSIQDPYPIYNDVTRLNLSYLIDTQGNALPPSLQGVAKDIIDRTFPVFGNTKISLDIEATAQELQELNEENITKIVGKYPVPIMYSQTSSRGYANSIPLSGSGRVSLYDNEGSGFVDFSFTAEGTASATSGRDVSFTVDPSLSVIEKDFGGGTVASGSYETGSIGFHNEKFKPNGTSGAANLDKLSQMQFISVQASLPTTYIYSADYFRKGNWKRKTKRREYTELTLKLGLKETKYNNSNVKYSEKFIPFVPEDIRLRVWRGTQPYDAGSVVDKIVFEESTQSRTRTRRGSFWRKSRYKNVYKSSSGLKLDRENKLHAKINEDAINDILAARGLSGKGVEDGGNIEGLEWIFIANSGENEFTKGTVLEWVIDGSVLAGNNDKNTILPSTFTGPPAAAKISMVGSKTHLLENDNTATAPYWVFTGSSGGGNSILDQRYLVMASSLFNEAYGNKFTQGELPYKPGPYDGFPGDQEPVKTKIGKPYSVLILEEGDEIRFGNNENYSYKIKTVYSPQDNIEGDGLGRIKIELDRPVPETVNKDFFLIRRYLESPNSLILEMPYPYTSEISSSKLVGGGARAATFTPETFSSPGILFPEYPVAEVENSASIIINELISKGVITS